MPDRVGGPDLVKKTLYKLVLLLVVTLTDLTERPTAILCEEDCAPDVSDDPVISSSCINRRVPVPVALIVREA